MNNFSQHSSLIWTRVPMVSCKSLRTQNIEDVQHLDGDQVDFNETWLWWSQFHELMDWDKRVGLVLEVSADLPSPTIMQRWYGEPIKAIIVSTSIFHSNKKG